ncbi:ArnT family glycosyltransferase [Amycolatopsis sp. NPDC059657]|uniref:ArnT family glycosyltransferase n=1 Tax=Amycolatopsis sp. NPDC059657 TaxID=3346899 RepID=UPI00366FEDF9
MTAATAAAESEETETAEFAKRPVFIMAAATGLVLLLVSGRYGYFGDELYFWAAGKHLDWGYADQPPVLPLLAALMDAIAPGSLVVFRLPAVLAVAATVVFTALIAREMGGRRKAQLLAGGAAAICGQFVGSGHYLATSTIDPFLWTVILWLIVRWIRTRDDNLLIWLGVATAVTLNVKFLIAGFWVVAGVAVLVFGPREIFARPKLWIGGAIAAVSILPTLLWQSANDWPQLGMSEAISKEVNGGWGGRAGFVPGALTGAGLVIGAFLVLFGLATLLVTREQRPYRFLGWTVVGLTVVFIVANGRYYYISGMYPICWAAAAVHIGKHRPALWWRWIPTWPVFALSALYTLPYVVPLQPIHWIAEHKSNLRPAYSHEEIGWPQMADSVSQAYQSLPPDVRAHTSIVTTGYWQAGALNRYGPERGLPQAYSASRGFWYFGEPSESATNVLFVGYEPQRLAAHFKGANIVLRIDNHLGVKNSSQNMPVWLLNDRTQPWPVIWPLVKDLKA